MKTRTKVIAAAFTGLSLAGAGIYNEHSKSQFEEIKKEWKRDSADFVRGMPHVQTYPQGFMDSVNEQYANEYWGKYKKYFPNRADSLELSYKQDTVVHFGDSVMENGNLVPVPPRRVATPKVYYLKRKK